MIQGTTSSGFAFSVSENFTNDFRFVRAFAKINSGKATDTLAGSVEFATAILGENGVDALCAHVREPDGAVPLDRVMRELSEIVEIAGKKDGDAKN